MRIATLCVLDHAGHEVWAGSALEFIRANEMTGDDVAEMVAILRGVPGEPPETYMVGGGTAQLFYVSLVESASPSCAICGEQHAARRVDREFCPHCDTANFPGYTRCLTCGRSATEAAA